jgi:hypothetical protein
MCARFGGAPRPRGGARRRPAPRGSGARPGRSAQRGSAAPRRGVQRGCAARRAGGHLSPDARHVRGARGGRGGVHRRAAAAVGATARAEGHPQVGWTAGGGRRRGRRLLAPRAEGHPRDGSAGGRRRCGRRPRAPTAGDRGCFGAARPTAGGPARVAGFRRGEDPRACVRRSPRGAARTIDAVRCPGGRTIDAVRSPRGAARTIDAVRCPGGPTADGARSLGGPTACVSRSPRAAGRSDSARLPRAAGRSDSARLPRAAGRRRVCLPGRSEAGKAH